MPDDQTTAQPVDDADAEVELEAFANELRDAVGRLQDDAAIALELNPQSQALDDVHLLRDVLLVYAERIMTFDTAMRSAIERLGDKDAWSPERIAATRADLIRHLAHVVENLGDDSPTAVITVAIETREQEGGD